MKDTHKKIEASNIEFVNSTAEQKRVLIAKDVIKFLDANKIVANSGSYIRSDDLSVSDLEVRNKEELNEVLQTIEECKVCAVGGLFYATLMRCDEFKVEEATIYDVWGSGVSFDGDPLFAYLGKYFTSNQLFLIETAFEVEQMTKLHSPDELEAALEFGGKYDGETYRLKAIMQNIIDNNGEFLP